MNFAVGTIIIVFLLLPGAVAIRAYYSSLRTKVSNSHVSLTELLVQGVFVSLIIHSIAICIINKLQAKDIYFDFLYNVVLGKDEKDFKFTNAEFTRNFLNFSYYIIACVSISYCFVKVCKYFIHKWHLHLLVPFLNNANHWFLIFNKNSIIDPVTKKKKEIDFIIVDVFVKPDIIYTGILKDFNYSPFKDELENIIIYTAKRRKITTLKNDNDEEVTCVSNAVDVPGDILVLTMSDIININIRYVLFEEKIKTPTPPTPLPGQEI